MLSIIKKELNVRGFWWVIFICILSYVIVKEINNKNDLIFEHFYTVGIIIDKYKGIKQPLPTLEFEYFVYNKKYVEAQAFDADKYSIKVGQKYLVMFSPKNIDNSEVLLNVPLADSIEAPYGGWEEPPFGLKGSDDIKW
ncbi:MAG: hypothetical protein ACK44D_01875 [Bacteroidia bacterium]